VECLGARLFDGQQRLTRPFRPLVERVGGYAGLYVDDRNRMRDGVVNLTSDPEALGVDSRTRFLLAGTFGLSGALQR
jgi:hypothetical protein